MVQYCLVCRKRLPPRNAQNLIYHWAGMCKDCLEADTGEEETTEVVGFVSCKECGKKIPYVRKGKTLKGKQLARLAGYLMSLCSYCYNMKCPERKKQHLPSIRWFHNGRWVDLRPRMSWWSNQTIITEGEKQEIRESMQLLAEEKDE